MPTYKPKYEQIAEHFRSRILSGEMKPGDKLPSGTELRVEWRTSAMTVRTAMFALRVEGLVESVNGVGVFVKDRDTQ